MARIIQLLHRIYAIFLSVEFRILTLVVLIAYVGVASVLQIFRGIYWVQYSLFSGALGAILASLVFACVLSSLLVHLKNNKRQRGAAGVIFVLLGTGILCLVLFGTRGLQFPLNSRSEYGQRYLLGIEEGKSEEYMLYTNSWDIVLVVQEEQHGHEHSHGHEEQHGPEHEEDSLELIELDRYTIGYIHHFSDLAGRRIVFSEEDIRLIIDEMWVNATPTALDSYEARREADKASDNLPLLRTDFFIGNDPEPLRIQIWAGSAFGFEFPVIVDGNIEQYSLLLSPSQRRLPFRVRLNKFSVEYYAHSTTPKHFESEIRFSYVDGEAARISEERSLRLGMPLFWGGYVFYQDSFQYGEGGLPASILLVYWAGQFFVPYVGIACILIGLCFLLVNKAGTAAAN